MKINSTGGILNVIMFWALVLLLFSGLLFLTLHQLLEPDADKFMSHAKDHSFGLGMLMAMAHVAAPFLSRRKRIAQAVFFGISVLTFIVIGRVLANGGNIVNVYWTVWVLLPFSLYYVIWPSRAAIPLSDMKENNRHFSWSIWVFMGLAGLYFLWVMKDLNWIELFKPLWSDPLFAAVALYLPVFLAICAGYAWWRARRTSR